ETFHTRTGVRAGDDVPATAGVLRDNCLVDGAVDAAVGVVVSPYRQTIASAGTGYPREVVVAHGGTWVWAAHNGPPAACVPLDQRLPVCGADRPAVAGAGARDARERAAVCDRGAGDHVPAAAGVPLDNRLPVTVACDCPAVASAGTGDGRETEVHVGVRDCPS